MFREAPMISLLVFGLPFSVISIVCYFLCCCDTGNDPNDPDESLDSDDELQHPESDLLIAEPGTLRSIFPFFGPGLSYHQF
jgi:hypothetical protein